MWRYGPDSEADEPADNRDDLRHLRRGGGGEACHGLRGVSRAAGEPGLREGHGGVRPVAGHREGPDAGGRGCRIRRGRQRGGVRRHGHDLCHLRRNIETALRCPGRSGVGIGEPGQREGVRSLQPRGGHHPRLEEGHPRRRLRGREADEKAGDSRAAGPGARAAQAGAAPHLQLLPVHSRLRAVHGHALQEQRRQLAPAGADHAGAVPGGVAVLCRQLQGAAQPPGQHGRPGGPRAPRRPTSTACW